MPDATRTVRFDFFLLTKCSSQRRSGLVHLALSKGAHDLPLAFSPFTGSPSLFSVAMRHSSWSQGFHNSLPEEQKPKHWTKQGRPTQTSSHLTHTSHLWVLRWHTNDQFRTSPFSFFIYFSQCRWDRWRKRSGCTTRSQQVEDLPHLERYSSWEVLATISGNKVLLHDSKNNTWYVFHGVTQFCFCFLRTVCWRLNRLLAPSVQHHLSLAFHQLCLAKSWNISFPSNQSDPNLWLFSCKERKGRNQWEMALLFPLVSYTHDNHRLRNANGRAISHCN